jgi:1,2-phenylacetyl-CoA epoxidase catalytic subunit
MHVDHWLRRLCGGGPESRRRLETAFEALGPDAGTVFTPLDGERALLEGGVIARSSAEQESAWRASLAIVFAELGLPPLPATRDPEQGRTRRSADFEWLWSEFTSVAGSEAGAVW